MFDMTIYEMLWFFAIYSMIGWVIEVSFHAVTLGKVVNRGFLNGPVCPVYGTGVLAVLIVLYEVGNLTNTDTYVSSTSSLLLFAIGIIFATLVELIAGFILDKLFHARWWDYSDRRFNLHGYICLEFSIIWGLAIAFVLRVIQPFFEYIVTIIPIIIGRISMWIFYSIFVCDVILTVLSVLKMNRELAELEELQASILRISDGMSEVVAGTTFKAMEKIGEESAELEEKKELLQASADDKRRELEARLEHLEKHFLYNSLFGMGRLFAAFPNMKHHTHARVVEHLHQTAASLRGRR